MFLCYSYYMSNKIPKFFFEELFRREMNGEFGNPEDTIIDDDVTEIEDCDKTLSDESNTLKFFE